MAHEERKKLIAAIEKLRGNRTLICFLNFDRASEPPLSGLNTVFASDAKECLFRVLKESPTTNGIDLFMYTRGGDTNSVWPIVSLIREFDPNFEVIVPYRCHSSGTLVTLGAKKTILGPLSELSPIDPTTGNQFNPVDSGNPKARLGISVEDVRAFRSFVAEQFDSDQDDGDVSPSVLMPFIQRLAETVHPLALGNVQRVILQIQQLAKKLLELHPRANDGIPGIVDALTTQFYSHLHMINRHEAKQILGSRVEFAPKRLANAIDELLRNYEVTFKLRKTFYLTSYLGDKNEAEVRFIGSAVESRHWSYLYHTKAVIRQYSNPPPNIQIQLSAGQAMPIIEGLPRQIDVEMTEQGWVYNPAPAGFTA